MIRPSSDCDGYRAELWKCNGLRLCHHKADGLLGGTYERLAKSAQRSKRGGPCVLCGGTSRLGGSLEAGVCELRPEG